MKSVNFIRISKNALELLSVLAMSAVFVLFALIFRNYPASNSYSVLIFNRSFTVEKISIFLIFLIACGINAYLFIVSRFPALYKYPVKVTAENIETQYHLAKIMLSVVQILISVMFGFIFIQLYFNGVNNISYISVFNIILFSSLIGFVLTIYFVLANKFK